MKAAMSKWGFLFVNCNVLIFSELLDGLKAHKRKVAKMQHKQKHMKFEETEIGRVS
jgi:hypothetical protein